MKRTALILAVILSAGLLAGLRLGGEKGPAFQAVAHLEVGALIGWAVAGRERFPAAVAVLLSVVELAMFLLTRGSP